MTKDIPKYQNYSIDHNGNVFSKRSGKHMKHDIKKVNKVHCIKLWDGRKHKSFSVIKLMAMAFIKNPNPSLYKIVITKNGNQDDLSINNIMWSTQSVKQRRAIIRHPEIRESFRAKKGVKIKFDKQKLSKIASSRKRDKNGIFINELTEKQRKDVKEMYSIGYSLGQLTDIFPLKASVSIHRITRD